MQNLSVREFKKCDLLSPHQFIFSSENQQWDRIEHTIKMRFDFQIMLIAFNPNTICFKSADNLLCLERVKHISMNDEKSLLGMVFTIVCGDSSTSSNDVFYTVVAR